MGCSVGLIVVDLPRELLYVRACVLFQAEVGRKICLASLFHVCWQGISSVVAICCVINQYYIYTIQYTGWGSIQECVRLLNIH